MKRVDSQIECFRTASVPRAQRLTFWNDVALHTFGNIAVDATAGEFSAQLERRHLGALLLATIQSAPARVRGGAHPEPPQRLCYVLFN